MTSVAQLPSSLTDLLRDPAPHDLHPLLAHDHEGGRHRVVRGLFGAANYHHFVGRELEAARAGSTTEEIWVARVLNADLMVQQVLLAQGRIGIRDESGAALTWDDLWHQLGEHPFVPAVEARYVRLAPGNPAGATAYLMDGAEIQMSYPASVLDVREGQWFPVYDETTCDEYRTAFPVRPEGIRVRAGAAPCWVLAPVAEGAEGVGEFIPLATPLGIPSPVMTGTEHRVHWVGDGATVLTSAQMARVVSGSLSTLGRRYLEQTAAARLQNYRARVGAGRDSAEVLEEEYGLHTHCNVGKYVPSL